MRSTLHCFGMGVVLFSLAPSTMSFSRGASHTSCQDMIPGHIRAQPQDPRHSYVTLRTSASSYLPGQFITEGDTLTHSDKQLKRNLSFVWRAPDAPMGDIRFFITVVQSYFVYWADIESAVVHDGSHRFWSGSKTTRVDGGSTPFALQEDEVSALAGPSPVPLRALYNLFMSSPSPAPSQKRTLEESLQTQNHIAPSDPESDFTPATQRTVVHPNPEPHPNLDQNFKLNLGHGLKPNLPNSDTKLKRPSNPSGTPNKEGKYPDIVPRHSAWELGMLLGCSAGLGMVLVVGVRYIYRQSCGKRTEVTLNDREREYERGERGLIHVQECGDLVRVRKIRENSFMLLAEYDILASPAD
ncbi:hypothetical protein F2P81_018091 [Scophthalmus maximus]|uniref:Reelin domain-containing protein n=1 Tax=Scophthalmus maximus TaxID=52904 RepID=A0A6A4S188_SCOMX|nr:hypothetical protein F2P81_018091 [Scophthalmus maximus]